MKASLGLFGAAALTIALAVAGVAHDGQAAHPICSDSCDIPAHQAAMEHGTAMGGATMPPGSSMSSMADMRMRAGHMTMTRVRPANAADRARADRILQTLRASVAQYRDYRVAEAAGYVPFHPEWPLSVYHFTNWRNAYANQFSFDPARPTALMYKRLAGGYELIGAMYTAPRSATQDELNARVPLSVAVWHEHTNLCLPPPGLGAQAFGPNARFGLRGSISTQEQCAQAGGTFIPVIYNWMVHVWPFETDPSKIWATTDHPVAEGR